MRNQHHNSVLASTHIYSHGLVRLACGRQMPCLTNYAFELFVFCGFSLLEEAVMHRVFIHQLGWFGAILVVLGFHLYVLTSGSSRPTYSLNFSSSVAIWISGLRKS